MLFVGDDWAEDHHDVEIIDEDGKVLARKRLPEGLAGITQLHELIAHHLGEPDGDPAAWPPVVVGIETDRGAWVASLVAASLVCQEETFRLADGRDALLTLTGPRGTSFVADDGRAHRRRLPLAPRAAPRGRGSPRPAWHRAGRSGCGDR